MVRDGIRRRYGRFMWMELLDEAALATSLWYLGS